MKPKTLRGIGLALRVLSALYAVVIVGIIFMGQYSSTHMLIRTFFIPIGLLWLARDCYKSANKKEAEILKAQINDNG